MRQLRMKYVLRLIGRDCLGFRRLKPYIGWRKEYDLSFGVLIHMYMVAPRQSRKYWKVCSRVAPYQVWCKEMTNVTKEVFWIFIHHLNVIPVPPSFDCSRELLRTPS
jgi:hypothetical protein